MVWQAENRGGRWFVVNRASGESWRCCDQEEAETVAAELNQDTTVDIL